MPLEVRCLMDNKEYVMEKLAFNYAGRMGRVLASLGNKKAKAVVEPLKALHREALESGNYTESLGKFIKDSGGSREMAEALAGRVKAGTTTGKEAAEGAESFGEKMLKPWSRKAKITAGVAAGLGAGGVGVYMAGKSKNQEPTEEEMYQMMQQGQM